jgi:hypothetical protein
MESDPGYIAWACENVSGFSAKLAAAGLEWGDESDVDQDPDEEYGDIWTVNR